MKERDTRLVRLVENGEDLDEILSERFIRLAGTCTAGARAFRVALSFDDCTMPLYELLFERHRTDIRWERLELYFTHDRAVAADRPDSRYGRAVRTLGAAGVLESNTHRMRTDEADLSLAAQRYETALLQHKHHSLADRPHFDLVLLALGPEGRIAALEPDNPALFQQNALVVPAKLDSDSVRWLTLTPAALSSAAHVWIVARGPGIAPTVHEVLEGDFDPNLHPVQALRPKNGEMVWFVDSPAAQRLAVASKELREQSR